MAKLPCILCGKEIDACLGHNTYCFEGTTYACCTGGCDRSKGAFDDAYVVARIGTLSDDEKQRSRVPDDETMHRPVRHRRPRSPRRERTGVQEFEYERTIASGRWRIYAGLLFVAAICVVVLIYLGFITMGWTPSGTKGALGGIIFMALLALLALVSYMSEPYVTLLGLAPYGYEWPCTAVRVLAAVFGLACVVFAVRYACVAFF